MLRAEALNASHPDFDKGIEIGAISAMDYLRELGATAVQTTEEWLKITEGFTPEPPSNPSREEYIDHQALRSGILRGSLTTFLQEK